MIWRKINKMTKEKAKEPQIRFKGFTDVWEQRKLGEIVKSHNAGVYIAKEKYGEGNNIIGVGNIYDSDAIDGEIYRLAPVKDSRFILDENDLIYGESSLVPEGIARTMYVTKKGSGTAFAWHTRRVKINNDKCNSHIITLELNYSKDVRNYLMRASTQTALTGITTESFFGATITYPSLKEQEQISRFFRTLDHLITLHQHKCDLLFKAKKTLLQKMFPKNGETTPEIRFKGFTGAWEQRKLGEVGSVSMCRRIFKEQTSENGDIPFYKIGTFGGEADAFISREVFEEYRAKYPYPKKGDILLSASGSIGRIVEFTGKNEYFQDSNIVWLNHDERLDNSFLKCFYSIVKWAGIEGSTIKRLYNNNILNTVINLPIVEEQQKIGAYFANLDHLITLHQHELEKLQNIKKSCLKMMFV